MAVDLGPDPADPDRIGGGRCERDRHAVGTDEPRPGDEGALLSRAGVGGIFADQAATARDQHAGAVEAIDIALDERARETRARRIERGLENRGDERALRSEEHTSELQSLMRHSYAVFCLKKKKHNNNTARQYN